MNRTVLGFCASLALLSAAAFAGPMAGHPNLKAAHHDLQEALKKVEAAQTANEFDMKGHAKKANELMKEAEGELRQAAEAANEK